jgi:pimeloyl-ACP methyl ester carboxylesterase
VLVHGTPGSAEGWSDLLAQPPAGLEVLAIDRPGFGRSGPGHAVTSLAAQADAVASLLADDGRANVVLGHSLGGAVAACAAVRHASRVHALVLLAASLDPALERVHPLQRIGHLRLVRPLLPRAIRHANDELLALKDELVALAPALGGIRCPVFIVHGTRDDLVPPANVAYLQKQLTGAASVVTEWLPGHNHFLPWNAPAHVRRAVARARVAAGGAAGAATKGIARGAAPC